jgi:cytochrome c oxidase subunit 3
MAINGENAVVKGPEQNMTFPGFGAMLGWLPLWNTVILLTSSVTVHFAHSAIKNNNRKAFNNWLGFTVLLGFIFLVLQAWEYHHA